MRTPSHALAIDTHSHLSGLVAQAAQAQGDATASGFRLLPTGLMALQTRLQLVQRAERSLDVQCYLIQNDETGRYFLRLLRDAAARGVRVRLLLDDLYTSGDDELLLGLAVHPNVELRLFNPFPAARHGLLQRLTVSLFDLGRLHRRMHNKLLVADGVAAIAGGRNMANDYFTRHATSTFLDLDTFAVGAVVPQLATLFDSYWNSAQAWPVKDIARSTLSAAELREQFDRVTGPATTPLPEAPTGSDPLGQLPLFDELDAGRARLLWGTAQAYADTPEKPSQPTLAGDAPLPDASGDTLLPHVAALLRGAQHEVTISSPYVVPTRRSMQLLQLLRDRGVGITLLTNSLAITDEPVVHSGYRRHRDDLLRMGVQLYELAPLQVNKRFAGAGRFGSAVGRLHAKTAAIDGRLVFIGSFNFDPRSAMHNTELGLIISSPELAAQVSRLVEGLKSQGAYRLQLAADGQRVHWMAAEQDGSESEHEEPSPGWWRRLLLELLGPLVPEDLL